MAILELLYYPDEKLHQVSAPVTEFNDELKQLVSDMFETMYADEGIGLAAPQINVFKKIVVIDVVNEKKPEDQLVLINPEFTHKEGSTGIDEGCLSVPGLRGKVERSEKVTVKAQNLNGEFFELNADGLLAICLQHEIDHLNGKLFIDYLSPLKRNMYRSKAKALAKERERQKKHQD